MKSLLRFVFAGFMSASAAMAQDDHANAPSAATLIPTGVTGVVGVLENDYDNDWFRFVAAPSLVYTIRVNNVILWDHVIGLKAFAEGSTLRETNSAHVASSRSIIWTNNGGLRSYYVGVSSMFQFTTGSYSIAVSTNDYDLDGDGMADQWELAQFGTLTNTATGDRDSDGVVNRDEYIAGTGAASAGSHLSVTNVKTALSGSLVHWPGVAYGVYRIEASTNLLQGTNWLFKQRLARPDTPGSSEYLDTTGTNGMRHYRVIYEY
jgi:hypothetical protein